MAVAKRGSMHSKGARSAFALVVTVLLSFVAAHLFLPWYTKRGASERERVESLPGDSIVADPVTGYTLAVTIRATPSEVWPWLKQMGQGRGGFYTHQWMENLLGPTSTTLITWPQSCRIL